MMIWGSETILCVLVVHLLLAAGQWKFHLPSNTLLIELQPSVSHLTPLENLVIPFPPESLVISPRWSHLRWKAVAPARVDVRATGQVIFLELS